MDEPVLVRVRARDVKPYHYAIWCSIAGGKPFANPIVKVRWTEDGKRLSFMLDSHNFDSADPDEVLELVDLAAAGQEAWGREMYKDWTLPASSPPPGSRSIPATPLAVEAWLQANPDQVAGILDRLQVADGWELDDVAWSRPRLPGEDEYATAVDVYLDTDPDSPALWTADVAGLGVIGVYETAEEAMAAADEALVGAGWALVGGVPDVG